MNVKPLHDKVLVRHAPAAERSRGGIIIPPAADARDGVIRGTVMAVGPGRPLDDGGRAPMAVSKGDEVLIPQYGGTSLKLDGREYTMLAEDQVLGVLDETELD